MPIPPHKAFTIQYDGIARELKTPCKVTEKFVPSTTPIKLGANLNLENLSRGDNEFLALWDTGATNTVINQSIIDHLGLKHITYQNVIGAYGGKPERRPVYRVCIYLPSEVCASDHLVTKGEVPGCDLLIGMDIIAQGDFAVTRKNKGTLFSYRVPSIEPIDFVLKLEIEKAIKAKKRYDPCPCGSGKQLKFCHWKDK